ncbi:MAG: BLUF domain-containing protein [Paracoccaceae bacterium]
MLCNVFFVSRSTHARGHLSDLDILNVSHENNQRHELTGCLLRGPKWFAHSLEGEYEQLARTFKNIQNDNRHGDLAYWWTNKSGHRNFEGWRMLFVSDDETKREVRFRQSDEAPFEKHRLTQLILQRSKHARVLH